MLRDWLKCFQRSTRAHGPSTKRKDCCLTLERLEDRWAPASLAPITTLASFNGSNGALPEAGLIVDNSGNLFGTTAFGGTKGVGTVFEVVNGSHQITTLATFNGSNGSNPLAGLVADSSGNLFGTTYGGGKYNQGTVFEVVNESNTITTLVSFNGTNGAHPIGGLVADSSGNLFGTSVLGGTAAEGTVFELPRGGSPITPLASFNGSNGEFPEGDLMVERSGKLLGTTYLGGTSGRGTVFEVTLATRNITTLASFNSSNGAFPQAGLVQDSSGNLFATPAFGGASGGGTLVEISSGSNRITSLASFNGAGNGAWPIGLIVDSSDNLFGATYLGGSGKGTVFEVSKGSNKITTLAAFNGTSNGAFPNGVVEQTLPPTVTMTAPANNSFSTNSLPTLSASAADSSSGNLFGTTEGGGTAGDGAVFEIGLAGVGLASVQFQFSSDGGDTWNNAGPAQTSGPFSFTFTSPLHAGAYEARAIATDKAGNSATSAPVNFTVVPVVTPSTANLAANATSTTINGANFDLAIANDVVTFSGGATGTVTAATATQLTVTKLTGLVVGPLSASVTVNGISSGSPVQVATVIPVVTPSTANLPANATTFTISGFGFSSTAANDTVTFSGGATGTVTLATATQLTVTRLTGLVAGPLSASVTVNGVSSGSPVQVATVIPVVTPSAANLPANATTFTINGFGFSTTAANDTVTFSGGATGTVTSATATQLTVTGLTGLVVGPLSASVTVNGVSSGSLVQVATVIPVVTPSAVNLPANATTFTISGFGFSTTAANDTVTFSGGATGIVTSATATQLTVSNLSGLTPGALNSSVTVNGVSSGSPVHVATVIPVVTPSAANLPANATTFTISGFGFSTTAANDIVTFSGGATGAVTSATATQLTVSNLNGLTPGALSASVTVNGISSGSPVQVATVTPVVTLNTANLPANATTLTVSGFGFSTTAANDIVTFSGGAKGTVTSATATRLTVTGLTGLVVGPLSASVTVSGISSGSPVQVATVIPVVTPNIASILDTDTSMTVSGFGFSTTPANNIVTFIGGATGTVTSAAATQLTVTGLTNLADGSLSASVTVSGISSGTAVQVATVIPRPIP